MLVCKLPDGLALLQQFAAALAVGIAGVAIFLLGGIHCALYFCAAGMVVGIQLAVGIPTDGADSLVGTGSGAAGVAGCRNLITDVSIAAGAGVGGVACLGTGRCSDSLFVGMAGMLTAFLGNDVGRIVSGSKVSSIDGDLLCLILSYQDHAIAGGNGAVPALAGNQIHIAGGAQSSGQIVNGHCVGAVVSDDDQGICIITAGKGQ